LAESSSIEINESGRSNITFLLAVMKESKPVRLLLSVLLDLHPAISNMQNNIIIICLVVFPIVGINNYFKLFLSASAIDKTLFHITA
jgi:hypothetical protein